jgi:GntR family transcriptional regulator
LGRKLTVDFALNPDEPAAFQLVAHIERMVALGVYRPGDDLPSAQALSEHLGISRPSVQKAYGTLEERAVTTAVRGGSTSIAPGADARHHFIRRLFSDVIAVARNLANPLQREEIRKAFQIEEDRHFRPRRPGSTEED